MDQKEDIKKQSEWIIKAFKEDGFNLDGTIESIIEVDRFFTKNLKTINSLDMKSP